MASIHTQAFRRVIELHNAADCYTACAGIDTAANEFLATLTPQNVLQVETTHFPVGKDGSLSMYQVTVTYYTP